MDLEWYPWYPSLYRADTMHLTAEQDGIYRRLIDEYMQTRQPLLDNDAALARIAGVSSDAWAIAAAILRPFFWHDSGRLRHKKCDEVLAEQDAYFTKQSVKGKKGAKKRWAKRTGKKEENSRGHATAIATPMPNDSKGQDMTGQDRKGYDDRESSNQDLKKSPLPPLAAGFEVLHHLSDTGLEAAKQKAPGYDIYRLASSYSEAVRGGRLDPPDHADRAFPAWCGKVTGGARP